MKKITKKTIGIMTLVLILVSYTGLQVTAETNTRAAKIKSKGIFNYMDGTVIIDSSDLTYLADEIDLLEHTYKIETVAALNRIGTYYKLDGSTTIKPEENTLPAENASILDFSQIMKGIENSQSIPEDMPYNGSLPGEEGDVSGNISGASEENISLGKAAWVEGELIVGTGGDNNSYYDKGRATIADGLVYYKSGSTADFTDIIESLGKNVSDYNSSNFCMVLANGASGSFSVNGSSTDGTINRNGSFTVSISYYNGKVTANMNTQNAEGIQSGNSNHLWTNLVSNFTIKGIIFDPSDTPFAS